MLSILETSKSISRHFKKRDRHSALRGHSYTSLTKVQSKSVLLCLQRVFEGSVSFPRAFPLFEKISSLRFRRGYRCSYTDIYSEGAFLWLLNINSNQSSCYLGIEKVCEN